MRRQELPYYVCGGYIASGVTVCDGLRVPMAYLDEAVLQGIRNASNRLLTLILRDRLGPLRRSGPANPPPSVGRVRA